MMPSVLIYALSSDDIKIAFVWDSDKSSFSITCAKALSKRYFVHNTTLEYRHLIKIEAIANLLETCFTLYLFNDDTWYVQNLST